jgi:hypothetical protein
MQLPEADFIDSVATPLGWFYLSAAAANVIAAGRAWRRARRSGRAVLWTAVAAGFVLCATLAFLGRPPAIPENVKAALDAALSPVTLCAGVLVLLGGFFLGRRFFVRPAVAWTVLNGSLVFLGLSMTDAEFAASITRPDNVPIVAMIYLLGFFTWLATYQAVINDRRMAAGQGPVEKDYSESVLVWPDLIYVELIGAILAATVLIVWSLVLKAPLEQPANPVVTPNPSKAPWYFLGFQEMLVFFDASIAGVILPALIILGLMAVPYLDFNPKGNGYYTIRERRFAYLVFQFGFLMLWILLILIGTFMRGPNWNFFGLYESRDPHKVLALANVKLSEYFWVIWLGRSMPEVAPGSGAWTQLATIAWREIAGLAALGGYFVLLPAVLARTAFKDFRRRMGLARYTIMSLLLLMMLMLPIKMILRWTVNLSYIVSIPEYFLNF